MLVVLALLALVALLVIGAQLCRPADMAVRSAVQLVRTARATCCVHAAAL